MQTDAAWVRWWSISLGVTAVGGVGVTVWFLIGGFRDLFRLFANLRGIQRDAEDDGVVRAAPPEQPSP